MNCSEIHLQLHDYVDGSLPPTLARAMEAHLAHCSACRAELASLQALRNATASLPREFEPERDLWPGIRHKLHRAPAEPAPGPPGRLRQRSRFLLAAASLTVIATLGWWSWRHLSADQPTWAVSSLAGTPQVGTAPIRGGARLRRGQWLETDQASRARLEIGAIGEVRLEPNSRVRLVDTAPTRHRLELTRGTLHALIWSPPRLFFVDTPAATAIDLGCAYTLKVDAEGNGVLEVTAGYVALEHGRLTAVIPAGMRCIARKGAGPGTPVAADAPDELQRALARLDTDSTDATALADVLRGAGTRDAVTLWHLLTRVPSTRRGDVFDRLSALHAAPEGVTREGILRADATMLARWAADLGLVL